MISARQAVLAIAIVAVGLPLSAVELPMIEISESQVEQLLPDAAQIGQTQLLFRAQDEGEFSSEPLTRSEEGTYRAILPPLETGVENLSFYLQATTSEGSSVSSGVLQVDVASGVVSSSGSAGGDGEMAPADSAGLKSGFENASGTVNFYLVPIRWVSPRLITTGRGFDDPVSVSAP